MRLPPFNPYIAIVVAVLAISTSAILVKLAGDAPVGIIAFYRLGFAVLMMLPIILLKYRHEFKKISRRDWVLTALSGLFLAAHFIFWFESLNYTSVTSSVVLISLQPVFAFIGTYLIFGERFSIAAVISLVITLVGSAIIGWGDFQLGGMALWGDLLAILATIVIVGYLLIGQKARRRLPLVTYTFIVYTSSVFFLLLYNIVIGNQFIGYSADTWGWFLLLAIVPTFLGHSVFNWALKWVSTSHVSMAFVFEPIGAAILAYFVLGERVTDFHWLGGTVIIFGLFLFIMSTTKKRQVTISQR